MPHDRVRTNHDELAQIARLFAQESDATARSLTELRRQKDTLQGGDWLGQAANRFYEEMDGSVLPALLRLQRALAQAGQVTARIGARLRQCEADAAHQLQDREPFAGQPVGGSGGSLPATGGEIGIPGGETSGGSLPATGGVFTGQPVGGSGGSLPATGGQIGIPGGETSGGSLPATGGVFTGQPVGGSGGSLPATGGEVGIPTGETSGGSLPATGGEVGIPAGETSGGSLPSTEPLGFGGSLEFGGVTLEGATTFLDGETAADGRSISGHVAGTEVGVTLDPFGIGLMQSSVTGEGVLLGGEAGLGWSFGSEGHGLDGKPSAPEQQLAGAFAGGAVGHGGFEAQLGGGDDGWARQSVSLDVISGNAFIGTNGSDWGVGGEASIGSVSETMVFGTKTLGITVDGELAGPGVDGFTGYKDGSISLLDAGGSLGGVSGSVGLNVFGYNVSLGAGAEVGGHAGVTVGLKNRFRLGPFQGTLALGDAK